MKTIAVGVGDCGFSRDPDDVLVTYALGSCIAVLIHDPVARVAGLLHFMLPSSEFGRGRVHQRPYMYADTGIPLLFLNSYKMGAEKKRLVVSAFGGAHMMDPEENFNIGRRNHLAMRQILAKNGILLQTEEVGGSLSRTVRLEVSTGSILLQHGDDKRKLHAVGGSATASAHSEVKSKT